MGLQIKRQLSDYFIIISFCSIFSIVNYSTRAKLSKYIGNTFSINSDLIFIAYLLILTIIFNYFFYKNEIFDNKSLGLKTKYEYKYYSLFIVRSINSIYYICNKIKQTAIYSKNNIAFGLFIMFLCKYPLIIVSLNQNYNIILELFIIETIIFLTMIILTGILSFNTMFKQELTIEDNSLISYKRSTDEKEAKIINIPKIENIKDYKIFLIVETEDKQLMIPQIDNIEKELMEEASFNFLLD
jgi:hypothetical protein